jgi:hypothetical protein
VMASSSHLKQGEKGKITAKISTVGKKGLTVETIEVVSNDPKSPKEILTLQATIMDILPLEEPESCR